MKTNIDELARKISELNPDDLDKLTSTLIMQYNMSATVYHFPIGIMPIKNNIPNTFVDKDYGVVNTNYRANTGTYKVHLVNTGNRKLAVVKCLKETLGIGLRDAKRLADNTPSLIGENLSEIEANIMKNGLEDLGADVRIM